ncbi:MAG: hypothetical protein IJ863_03040 [Spirochaetales bacterium]|nr:hypothetical protein [Spirochaetales bacterium]
MLFRKTRKPEDYDHGKLCPAIRSSICTGEKVAGFKDRRTGHFTEIMLIKTDKDLETFRSRYGIGCDIEEFY